MYSLSKKNLVRNTIPLNPLTLIPFKFGYLTGIVSKIICTAKFLYFNRQLPVLGSKLTQRACTNASTHGHLRFTTLQANF